MELTFYLEPTRYRPGSFRSDQRAYQSLLNPLPRAEYLLKRHHIPVSETDQLEDMELMAEVIEARETIEDAEDPNEINVLMEDNQGLFSA